ncbi:hypothetical protein BDR22DRAFT_820715 [Usnea florida]
MPTTSTSSATHLDPQPSPPPPPAPDPQRTAEARAAFTAHLSSIGTSHISALESRVADIHTNAAVLSKQESDVLKQTKKLAQQARKQQGVAKGAAEKLKELGDIQNWAEVLERDLLVLEEAVERGERGEGGDSEGEGEPDGKGLGNGQSQGKGGDGGHGREGNGSI